MISIVVCHRNHDFLKSFKANVEETIGVEHEIIVVDNSKSTYSIFEAYNIGAGQAKYGVICFSHEDLVFHTKNWGNNVIDHFSDPSVGIIGICGGNCVPSSPAPWWNSNLLNDNFINCINSWPNKPTWHDYQNPKNEPRSEVILLDGAWLCIRKSLFSHISFDTATFSGFHCYDSDICLQVLQKGFKAYVVFDVLLEHFSPGTINLDWKVSVEKLVDKWRDMLPAFAKDAPMDIVPVYELECLLTYCYWLQGLNLKDREIRLTIRKYLQRIKGIKSKFRTYILLRLWQIFGYKLATRLFIPFRIINKNE